MRGVRGADRPVTYRGYEGGLVHVVLYNGIMSSPHCWTPACNPFIELNIPVDDASVNEAPTCLWCAVGERRWG